MRAPVPTAREVRATFYVVAICALALTAAIVWGIVHKVRQSDDVLHIAVSQADQVDRLTSQQDANAEIDARERATLRHQLAAVRADLRRQRAIQRELLAYLKAHGLQVPDVFTRSGGGSSGSSGSKRADIGTAAPPAPGNSGPHRNPHAHQPGTH